jgi:uncharacterized membrane protein YhaH (DUF805 family)
MGDQVDWQNLFGTMQGRINRQKFWIGAVILAVINIIAQILDGAFGTPHAGYYGVIGIIVGLVLIYPSIALSAKRWHDRNKSAWWILIAIIPVIGWIWALVENGFLKGTAGANTYGPDPLQG